MTNREIHLEILLGKRVLDSTGKEIGRIHEMRAAQQGDEWVIQEYVIGPAALLERLSAWTIVRTILPLIGAREIHGGYIVHWNQLDLTNPEKPRLLCKLDELKTLSNQTQDAD